MSAIYGIVRLDGRPVLNEELATMRGPMAYWGPDRGGIWQEAGAGLGQLVAIRTEEDAYEVGPIQLPSGAVVAAAARIDNRDELLRELDVPAAARPCTPDGRVVAMAYERWGERAVGRLLGDWAFAAWDPRERKLLLARDQYGSTALYYHRSADSLVFASSLKGLLSLPGVPVALDEIQLAHSLTIHIGDGTKTMYKDIRRLPTGQLLRFGPDGMRSREYWSLLDVPEIQLARDEDYVEQLLDLLTTAVRARLRSAGPVAATLSAGLDSAAVTALAAAELGETRLTAYTARPAFPEVAREMPGRLVDEWPRAELVAAYYRNVDHVAIDGRDVKPLAAIEHSLATHDEPEHAVPNLPWVRGLLDTTRESGARVLLTGQMGNGSISWPGDDQHVISSLRNGELREVVDGLRSLSQASRYGWPGAAWHGIVRPGRRRVTAAREQRDPTRREGWRRSLMAPSFAERIGLRDALRGSTWDPTFARATARERRLSYLLPGKLPTGAWWHQRGAAQGVEARDPTADVRVLEFCVGTPDRQFARDGHQRWLVRRALATLVPTEVAWSTERGVQAADLAHRLRADAAATAAAVQRVVASDAAREYLDVNALRDAWQRVAAGESDGASIVTGGLAFGLFLLSVTAPPACGTCFPAPH